MTILPRYLVERRARRKALAARDRANDANRRAAWAEAIPDYRAYLDWKPDDFAIQVQLGHMLAETGQHVAAHAAYAMAEGLRPNDADLLLCWGHLRRRMADDEGARDFYRRSVAIDGNAAALTCLAELTPEPEPEPEPETLPIVGGIRQADANRIQGWALFREGTTREDVEFRRDGEIVGHTPLLHPLGGRSNFAAVLDIAEEGLFSAHRRSDGIELEGSPFLLRPAPSAEAAKPLAWAVPIEILRPFAAGPDGDGEVALFVTHSATGLLKPHVLPYLRALDAQGIAIVLIVVVDHPIELPDELGALVAGLIVRANSGYDFAAWAHALKLFPDLYGAATLYFANDSMFGPADVAGFDTLLARIRANSADLIGLTESREHGWHIQSYFFAVRQRLSATLQFQTFFEDVRILEDKDAVIRTYEVPLATMVRAIGRSVDVLFPVPVAINPTLFAWRSLLDAGFPFVKLLLLRGFFPDTDLSGWRERLGEAGFDLSLIDLTVRACAEALPQGPQPGLVARPPLGADGGLVPGQRLKVAFFGPWNYDSGLAAASRGMIAALRRTGVRLNLHPIRKPFHVHRPSMPPVDITEYDGPADIAIVHLNPDSWHLLTDDQLAQIRRARWRIGYWVWEMDRLPPAWFAEFGSVDRIWAPSHYCADIFAAQSNAPVDVIPHAVPILPTPAIDRDALFAALGIATGDRIILYVFDGASYLVRKNPASLIRAFATSRLAERGWTLVLKTKHLMDRAEDGAGLRALAESSAGVALIDRAMPAAMLHALVATADLYASPHCSEGFGLTIAEAMAAGRPVIATDFGGSRDFLDSDTGYPVRAHHWTLDQDSGHYTQGNSWARIDEPALAATLIRAADAQDAGDLHIGEAARARIAGQLSYDAVAERIAKSLAATIAAAPQVSEIDHAPGHFDTAIHAGLPLDRAEFGARFAILPLTEDGSAPPCHPALTTAPDHWIVVAPAGAQLHPLLPGIVDDHARHRPDVAIFYADDVANTTRHAFDQVRLKPGFDPTLLAAQDYIGAPLIVRATTFATLGGLRAEAGTAAGFDLVLRAYEAGFSIDRIPEVLLAFFRSRVVATAIDRRRVLAERAFAAPYDIVDGRAEDSLLLRRRFDDGRPAVTLLIPTCRSVHPPSGRAHLELLLDRLATVDWPLDRLTVIIGDDIAGDPEWAKRAWPFALRRIEMPHAPGEVFSYARKMNRLIALADTEYLVMMNDDVRPERPDWLVALMTFAMDEGVGGVGARLLYEDGRVQHAGIIPHQRAICHAWLGQWPANGSYQDWAEVHREWSMVTGAVFATRRSVLAEVGGFDEDFALEYNDVDLCLRIRALGLRLVVNPAAEMIHVEKASRGQDAPNGRELSRFLTRWGAWLEQDPAWHPKLRRDTFDLLPKNEPEAWYRL